MSNRSIHCFIAVLALFGLASADADPIQPIPPGRGEVALYNTDAQTIGVVRDHGQVQLYFCYDYFFPPKTGRPAPDAALKYLQARCVPVSGPGVEISYITGGTSAVVTVAGPHVRRPNDAEGGEMDSTLTTYKINTYPEFPVGLSDTVVYTGAKIVFDHQEVPKLSTGRGTFELVAVTRAK